MMTSPFFETPENEHLVREHHASAEALKTAAAASDAYRNLHGSASPELEAIVLAANQRHMDAHAAVRREAARQASQGRN